MVSIPDITDAEQWAVSTTLKERWTELSIELQVADVEIRMHPGDRELAECPALFWQVDEASFIVIKVAERVYRSQFYYRGFQQYGTGVQDFDDIAECVVTMLQVHADQEMSKREDQT
jgi:hypothetical protein